MKVWTIIILILFGACSDEATEEATIAPPFYGTIFLDPDIITASDPTAFESIIPTGQGMRTMFDRRVDSWVTVNAYLFEVTFNDGLSTEVQVNPEFGSSDISQVQAEKYAAAIGQLPTSLRQDVHSLWIHQGVNLYGGGNNSILIHTGQSALYEADGILEEVLVHEATHTSLDATHANAVGWVQAQKKDPTFISTYARDYPQREDLAETFLLYLAVKYRSDRISNSLKEEIQTTIPNRIKYLDEQNWSLHPLE